MRLCWYYRHYRLHSYVAFPLYDSVSVLPVLFMPAGGLTGLYGLMHGLWLALFDEYLRPHPDRGAVTLPLSCR